MSNTESIQFIEPEAGNMGAQVIGLNSKELPAGAPEYQQILDLIYKHKIVVLRNQDLELSEYVELTRKLGTPQIYFQDNYHHPDHPEVFVSSNVNKPGEKVGVAGTGRYWHTDCSFEEKPLSLTSVRPVVFPPSARQTFYIDMSKVYKTLPEDLKKMVAGGTFVHDAKLRYKVQPSDIDRSLFDIIEELRQMVPPMEHPAVIQHPVTNEEILYMSGGFTKKLAGLSYEENEIIMKRLRDFVEQEAHIYTHHWEEGDIIIWDNRYLIHKASSIKPGEQSKSYRIGIYDNYPFYTGLEK